MGGQCFARHDVYVRGLRGRPVNRRSAPNPRPPPKPLVQLIPDLRSPHPPSPSPGRAQQCRRLEHTVEPPGRTVHRRAGPNPRPPPKPLVQLIPYLRSPPRYVGTDEAARRNAPKARHSAVAPRRPPTAPHTPQPRQGLAASHSATRSFGVGGRDLAAEQKKGPSPHIAECGGGGRTRQWGKGLGPQASSEKATNPQSFPRLSKLKIGAASRSVKKGSRSIH